MDTLINNRYDTLLWCIVLNSIHMYKFNEAWESIHEIMLGHKARILSV